MTRTPLAVAIAVALFGSACQRSPHLPGVAMTTGGTAGSTASTGGKAGNAGGAQGGGGGSAGGATANGGAANAGGAGGADVPNVVNVTDVAATTCATSTTAGTLVIDSGPRVPSFDRFGIAGTRRYALSRADRVFVEFGADGSQVSAFVDGVLAASGDASGVTVAFGTTDRLFLQRYDGWLGPVGSSIDVATGAPCGASIAPLGDRMVAAWTDAGQLHVRIVDPTGASSADVAVANADAKVACWSSAVATSAGVAIAWTRSTADAIETYWSLVTSDGHASEPVNVFRTAGEHEVVAMASTSSGYALAINQTGATSAFIVVRIDGAGKPVNPAYRFIGTGAADDMAARGDEVAVTASLADGREALRVIEPGQAPTGTPPCLDDNPADGSYVGHASVLGDTTGYAVLVRHRNGSAWLESPSGG